MSTSCSTGSRPYEKLTRSMCRSPSIRVGRTGSGLVVDLGLGVEHQADLLHRGAGRLHLAVEVGQLLQRLEHEVQQEDGRDERPDRQRAVLEQPAADPEHRPPSRRCRGTRCPGRRASSATGRRCWCGGSRRWPCRTRRGTRARGRTPGSRPCPDTDSAICAVRAAIVSRTRRNAGVRLHLERAREDDRRRQDHERDAAEPPVEDEEAADRRRRASAC